MFSISSLIFSDFEFKKIDVEVALTRGLPYFEIIGLPGKIVKESSFRIKEAILKTMKDFPEKKIIVNLSPSDIPKNSKYLDLVIAFNILIQYKLEKMKNELKFPFSYFFEKIGDMIKNCLFIGELGLDGTIKADENILSFLINSYKYNFNYIFTSSKVYKIIKYYNKNDTFIRANVIYLDDLNSLNFIISKLIKSLNENNLNTNFYLFIKKIFNENDLFNTKKYLNNKNDNNKNIDNDYKNENTNEDLENERLSFSQDIDNNRVDNNNLEEKHEMATFDDYIGNDHIKYGLLIGICGFHNIFLRGATGTGKTMLSRIVMNYLPELTYSESMELVELYSKFDVLNKGITEIRRPIRMPHHSITETSMLGGGNYLNLGEVSLAHRGLLILDEINLYKKTVIESLREPVNDNYVSISRVKSKIRLPSTFLLLIISNLCPCGALGDDEKICICSKSEILNFNRKISNAIIDRIDIFLNVPKVDLNYLNNERKYEDDFFSDSNIRKIIKKVQSRSIERYESELDYFNGKINFKLFFEKLNLNKSLEDYIKLSSKKLGLSFRQYEKILRLSRTIADIEDSEKIEKEHVETAIFYIKNLNFTIQK